MLDGDQTETDQLDAPSGFDPEIATVAGRAWVGTDGAASHERQRRGASIDRYVVLDVLGEGGMGVVYVAYDPELDRKVAIKLLRPTNTTTTDADAARARLVREAQSLARLSHPNVVNVHDVGQADGEVWVAMEHIEGLTLRQWRAQKNRTRREILDVFIRAGRGLMAAHAAGLVHRDFKPDNVLVGDDGRPRVLDFGLAVGRASFLDDSSDASGSLSNASSMDNALTEAGTVVGTPAYMAPEQRVGEAADAATDQFAFCVALYEALYDERPYTGTRADVASAAASGDVSAPPAGSTVPTWLRRELVRGLSPHPDDRHESMEALLVVLARDPKAAQRRYAAMAGLVLLGGGATGAAYLTGARGTQPCAAVGETMDGVWSPDRREATQTAFLASGLPYADDTFERVGVILDGYATQWKAAALDACTATHVTQTQSGAMLDRRTACLNTRREGMDALLVLFAEADAQVVARATTAVRRLPPIGDCEDLAVLNSGMDPPSTDLMRAQVDALTVAQKRAGATAQLGRYREVLAQHEALVRRAEEVGYLPLLCDLLHDLARTQDSLAMPVAEQTLHRAFAVAVEAGNNRVAARIASQYAQDNGIGGDDLEASLRWADVAQSFARRLGGDARVELAVLNVRSTVAVRRGHDEEALQGYQTLLARMDSEGEDASTRSVALMNLGAFHARRSEMELAEHYLREAVELTMADLGPKHPTVLDHKSNLSRLLVMRHKYTSGVEVATEVLALQHEAYGKRHPSIAATLEALAIANRHLGNFDLSEQQYRESLSQRREFLGPDAVSISDTLRNLAVVRDELGFVEDALALAQEARAMTARLPPSAEQEAIGDASVGSYLVGLERYDEAAPLLEKASAFFDSDTRYRAKNVGVLLRIGRCHQARGDESGALKVFERALDIAESDSYAALAAWPLVYVAGSLRALEQDPARVLELAKRARALQDEADGIDADLQGRLAELLDSP